MRLKRTPRSGTCSQRIMSSIQVEPISNNNVTFTKSVESESGEVDALNSDSGVRSHSNSPDGNSGFSGGGSSGHHTSADMELPSMAGERDPADTPSPLFGSDMAGSLKDNDGTVCPYCHRTFRQPRLLFCLHPLCEDCIIALLEGHDGKTSEPDLDAGELEQRTSPEQKPPPGVIRCPVCKQDSSVGNDARFAHSMLLDYVAINLLDASNIDKAEIACESCKTKENATARCQQCSNFLCANCEAAHDFMMCFTDHEVVKLTEIKRAQESGERIYMHRSIFCQEHTTETLKFYCTTCQVPVCNECVMSVHCPPGHSTQKVDALAEKLKGHLAGLITAGYEKSVFCQNAACNIERRGEELKNSVDMAREKIDEAFQQYKDLLETRRLQLHAELGALHEQHEAHLTSAAHNYERTSQKITDACKFTERLLSFANTMELLMSDQTVTQQFNQLQHSVPKGEIQANVDYTYSKEKFAELLKSGCGSFQSGLLGPSPSSVQIEELTKYIAGTPQSPNTWQSPPQITRPPSALEAARAMDPRARELNFGNYGGTDIGQQFILRAQEMRAATGADGSLGSFQQLVQERRQPELQGPRFQPPSNPAADMQRYAQPLGYQYSQIQQQNPSRVGGVYGGGAPVANQMRQGFTGIPHGLANNLLNLARLGGAGDASTPQEGGFYQSGGMMCSQKYVPNQFAGMVAPHSGNTSPSQQLVRSAAMTQVPNSCASIVSSLQTSSMTQSNYNYMNAGSGRNSATPLDSVPAASSVSGLMNGGTGMGFGQLGPAPAVPLSRGITPPVYHPQDQDMSHLTHSLSAAQLGNGTTRACGNVKTMMIKSKFGSLGPANNQFNSPHGFCLGLDDEIVVADTNNHRIQIFDKEGTFLFQFGVAGKEEGQLWYPRKVAVTRTSDWRYIVCDRGSERSRMQIFSNTGSFMRKIAIRYIDIVAGLSVDSNGMIVAVDSVSPTVFRIDDRGELNKWFDCSDYMKEPSDIVVSGREYYICDFKGHCVCVFSDEGNFIRRIGCEKLTNFPNGIDISGDGDVLVGDSHGNKFHVSIFKKNGEFLSEYDCPFVKVSRCCGLRITSEGYIITLAKNNHHVLVLDTIYLQ